jgi:hypothetical protein
LEPEAVTRKAKAGGMLYTATANGTNLSNENPPIEISTNNTIKKNGKKIYQSFGNRGDAF